DAVEGAGEIGRFLGQVPGLLTRAGTLLDQFDDITRNGLVLSPETVSAIGTAEARRNRWTTIALWVIAALLFWIAWMLVWSDRDASRLCQLLQLVDALGPACFHSGEHLRRNRHETDCVCFQDERCLAVLLCKGDCGFTLEQMVSLFVDGNIGEDQPFGHGYFAEHAFH